MTAGTAESIRRYLTKADGTTVGAEGHAKAEALRKPAHARIVAQMPAAQQLQIEERLREQDRQNAYRITEAVVGA